MSLTNLHFQPLEASNFAAFFPNLKVVCRHNIVTVTDAQESAPDQASTTESAVIWSGPVTDAVFTQETVGGVHILRDANGSVLWSNAADLATPDLLIQKTEDGQARLTNKAGAVLWSGRLPPTSQQGVQSQSSGSQMSIVMPSVRVDGENGLYRVTAGKLLWSGYLPVSPLIVIRDGHKFLVMGPKGGESGWDETHQISMTTGFQRVTVADTKGRTLGTQTVDSLTVRYTRQLASQPRELDWLADHKAQDGQLDAVGTLLLTYRDSTGRVVQWSKVYRDAHGGCGSFVITP